MIDFRTIRKPAFLVTAGFLSALLVTGCDDPAEEQNAAQPAQTDERSPGASPQSLRAEQQAQLTMEVKPQGYLFIEGRHRFTQTRVFTETAGVGVTLTKGRVCVSQGKECVEAEVAYRVDAGKELALQRHYVATEALPDRAVIEYTGIDDNGNTVAVKSELELVIPEQETRD